MADRSNLSQSNPAAARIGIVEDQALVLSLLAELCRSRFGWDVVLMAKNAQQTRDGIKAAKPDALLIDINLPDEDGISLAVSLKKAHPSLRIVMLSAECTEYTIFRVRQSGLDGYVDKNADPDHIQEALLTVIRDGRTFFSPLVREVAKNTADDALAFNKVLSVREHELLPDFGMGYSDAKIGEKRAISSETVRKHRENIMRKLGLQSVSELVHYCIEKGFVQTRPDGDVRPATWPPPPRK